MSIRKRFLSLGLDFPTILLPKPAVDLARWAVIACDQFTSDPDYWQSVEEYVGDAPSTLHITLPEIYLDQRDSPQETERIRRSMQEYLSQGIFREIESSAIHVERTLSDGTVRTGLVLAVDLEAYDYRPETEALVRASEETIPARLPPRAAIRDRALLETPHVLVLYDDPRDTVRSALDQSQPPLQPVYSTRLMLEGGTVSGRRLPLDHPAAEAVATALETLRRGNLLFATGDGNHSLAAAKTVWEQRKSAGASPDDAFRYCLVELVNVFDPGLPFHPIHRIGSGDIDRIRVELQKFDLSSIEQISREAWESGHPEAEAGTSDRQIVLVGGESVTIATLAAAKPLPVECADQILKAAEFSRIDYVHGAAEACTAADKLQGVAILLPEFPRGELFPTVATQGTLPRKAFSLGRARDKRYYLECRALE